jgi:prolyl 4-hydroxylase
MFYQHLKGLLSKEECLALINSANERGFEQSLVNQGDGTQKLMTHVRNNERVIFDDKDLAKKLENRLQTQHDFPYYFKNREYEEVASHFRLYKYSPGQYFKTHRDGSFETDTLETEITVLFYLNDCDGGETVLMPFGKSQAWAHIPIKPKAGDVLMFEHHMLHEGLPVDSGEKYVLRTDLFYVK